MAERYYINNNWGFTENFSENYLKDEALIEGLKKVTVPHTVKETPFNYFDEHIYQLESGYFKVLRDLKQFKGKHVELVFEGVAHRATVYINGENKLTHKSGYTAFSVDITKEVETGEDVYVGVKVDSKEDINQPPFGYVIDYMTYGGIYRDVYVSVTEKNYIKDLFLYADFNNGIHLISDIETEGVCSGLTIRQTVLDKVQSIIGGGKSRLSIDCEGVELWSVENPVLYTVKTELINEGGEVLEVRYDRFGFRKSEFKASGYYLNGEKLKIRGLNRHQSFPYVGYAMPASMQELDAEILKNELKLNAVRTSHYPQSIDFINKCDELGLLVFMEIPGWQHIGDKDWQDIAVENVKEMILQYRNHPSIILWGVRINESVDCDDFYKRTNEMAHLLDPTRQTGGVRAHKKSHLFEDVYTYNDFVHDGGSKGCEPKSKVTSDVNKPYLVSEYNGHMYPTKAFDWEEHRREHAIRHANVLNAIALESDIAGSFGWCMFDYNTHKDFGSGDRICYHGVMDMFRNEKLAANVYKCFGTDDVSLEISSTMDIGEHPGCNRGAVWIFTNADSVRMYKNGRLLKEYKPEDSPYKGLPHGPIMIDDFVGNAVAEGENFSPKLASEVKEMMNATALYGLSKLPKRVMFLAAKAILIHHLSMGDAVRLYNKYVGDWGGTSTTYKFEAIKDGEVKKTLVYEPSTSLSLKTDVSSTVLKPGRTYDVALVRIKAIDQNGNLLPFFNEPVSFETEGDIEVIGPKTVSLKGGLSGVYVRTKENAGGEAKLKIVSSQAENKEIIFKIERDTRWNVLK